MGGLKGYSGEKWMSRKKTPPSYTEPGGPRIVETHSYKLSPFGPALQLGGGSSVISASSFWMRFVDVPNALLIFGFVLGSGFESATAAVAPPPVPAAFVPAAALVTDPAPLLVDDPPLRPRLLPPVPLAPVLDPALADMLVVVGCGSSCECRIKC